MVYIGGFGRLVGILSRCMGLGLMVFWMVLWVEYTHFCSRGVSTHPHQVQLDSILICSAITACEKSNQWQVALHLAKSMASRNLEASTVGYNAAISALSGAGLWKMPG